MSQFVLHPSHGYSLASENGGDAREALDALKTRDEVHAFRQSTGLSGVWEGFRGRIISVVSGGIDTPVSKMRGKKAETIYKNNPDKTRIMLTGRFTHRELKNPPHTTDVRALAVDLVKNGVDPRHIILEEFSNCTLGNAIFGRLLLGATGISAESGLMVLTSSWALKRAEICFHLLYPERDIDFTTVSGDITPEDEKNRMLSDWVVNNFLYGPDIAQYQLDTGDRLMRALDYLRTVNIGTPGNSGNENNKKVGGIMRQLTGLGLFQLADGTYKKG